MELSDAVSNLPVMALLKHHYTVVSNWLGVLYQSGPSMIEPNPFLSASDNEKNTQSSWKTSFSSSTSVSKLVYEKLSDLVQEFYHPFQELR